MVCFAGAKSPEGKPSRDLSRAPTLDHDEGTLKPESEWASSRTAPVGPVADTDSGGAPFFVMARPLTTPSDLLEGGVALSVSPVSQRWVTWGTFSRLLFPAFSPFPHALGHSRKCPK